MDTSTKQIKDLFDAQVHLGHKTNRIHPKARAFIYKIENSVSIIDLTRTADLLDKAEHFVSQLAAEGKQLLVVVTKKIASSSIEELCKKNGVAYITLKWPAGLLTNFEMISKNIKKLKEMKKAKAEGEWQKLVKHEQSKLNKELNKLQRYYGGLLKIEKLPDALFIVDIKKEKNAVLEAKKMSIPLIALVDTNADPSDIHYPIPGNDDSLSAIEYIVKEIIKAYVKDKKVSS